jgi:D-sedoheptulose 7-phosphate isomerase
MGHIDDFTAAAVGVLGDVADGSAYDEMVYELAALRERGGRLFCLGVGGGAANAAHAVCDFRKLCGIEAYAPADGTAELTARTNDEGWATVFKAWLRTSRLSSKDALMVFSVGGGQADVSACIYEAVQLAKQVGARVLGVVGRAEGVVARFGDAVVVTGIAGPLLTPVTETAQVAVLHALVSDPRLQTGKTKW